MHGNITNIPLQLVSCLLASKFCPCRGWNSYPPDQELGVLTKELASRVQVLVPVGSLQAQHYFMNIISYSISHKLSSNDNTVLVFRGERSVSFSHQCAVHSVSDVLKKFGR